MIGKTLGNRYEIIEKIGEGGMAMVYKAKCNLLNRFVAVKILKSEFVDDKEFIEKFNRESQSAAKLSHPNIVNIYDIGIEDNINYIIMEYVDGITLKRKIMEDAPFSNERIASISSQIAMALAHAHKNKIIHRDIKPQNILITKDDRIKVADFGIARAISDATVINSSNLMGTVHYASPEQLKGSMVDERTDIYSLGVIMYEMATGKLPYDGEAPVTVALKHMNEVLVPPNLINKNLYDTLNGIIIKSMDKISAYRYDSALSLLEDLSRFDTSSLNIAPSDFESGKTTILPKVKQNASKRRRIKKKKDKPKKYVYVLAIFSAFLLSIIFILSIAYPMLKGDLFNSEVTVPSLVDTPFSEAKTLLTDNGLDYVVHEERYDRSIVSGNIITQDPEANEIVKEGYTVKLTVSLGKSKTKVPNLLNLTHSEALIAIENKNLTAGEIEYVYSDLPMDIVINQSPKDGSLVDELTPVSLMLSQGQAVQTFIMPDFKGKSLESAKSNLRDLGLSSPKISYSESGDVDKNFVISQNVSPGSEITKNTAISLVVSSGSHDEDDFTSKTLMIPLKFKEDEAQVTVVMTQDGVQSTLFDGTAKKSDQSLSLVIKGRGTALVEVFFDGTLAFSKEEIFD